MSNFKKLTYAAAGITGVAAIGLWACKGNGQFAGYEKSPSGLYSKFYVNNEGGRKPKTGEYASILLKYTTAKDSVMFDSHSIKESDNGLISEPIMKPTFQGGIEEALMSMSEGDSASFKISADSVFLKTFRAKELPKFIEKGSYLTFYIKMGKVKTQQELMNELSSKEVQQRNDYLKQNNITVEPTASGLYFIEQEPGKGALVKPGQTASVKYSGSLLNGRVFDASDLHQGKLPFDVPVGQQKVIPGWDEALQKMKKGGKATVIIPSSLAYGYQGQGPIPGFSTLVFTMEVVDVKDTPPAAPGAPSAPGRR